MNAINPKYLFKMAIGDWSGDGHDEFTEYVIASNKTVEEVREAHFLIQEQTGVNVHTIVTTDVRIRTEDLERLRELGYSPDTIKVIQDDGVVGSDDVAKIWMFLLCKVDPELYLAFEEQDEIPSLHFYGFDEQKRHIGHVGYNIFA